MPKPRKKARPKRSSKVVPPFVQIAVSSGDDETTYDTLYGLDADGRVWECIMSPGWYGWSLVSNRNGDEG